MTDSNTLCHSRARTRQCNYPRFTIKYIIHTRSSLHPRFPSSASILSTMPGQPSPNLSLSSLPIPSYRTIRLLPFSPSGSPSDYSGPDPHQMLTQDSNNTVQEPSALHSPLLKRRVALNTSVVFCNLLRGIHYVLFRLPCHFVRRIPFPANQILYNRFLTTSSFTMIYNFFDLVFGTSICDDRIRFFISSCHVFRLPV